MSWQWADWDHRIWFRKSTEGYVHLLPTFILKLSLQSLFHRIADSITGFVPSSILPAINVSIGFPITTIQVSPAKSVDPLKGDLRANLKRTNDVLDHCSEPGPKDKAWGYKEHSLRYTNVDLDATDKSESECSLHSFSTSGVSSLMPKSWVLGCKNGQSRSTAQRMELCSDSYTNTVCNPLKTTCCKQSPSCQTSRSDFKTYPYPLPKRQRLSTTPNLSPSSTWRSRLGTTYGGAASCRNARELFEVSLLVVTVGLLSLNYSTLEECVTCSVPYD